MCISNAGLQGHQKTEEKMKVRELMAEAELLQQKQMIQNEVEK